MRFEFECGIDYRTAISVLLTLTELYFTSYFYYFIMGGANRFQQKKSLSAGGRSNTARKYSLEKIVRHEGEKGLGRTILYEVKWLGYPESENTWEPEHSLVDSQESIDDYWARVDRLKKYDSRPKRGETYRSKKDAGEKFSQLIVTLRSMLKLASGEKILVSSLIERVAADLDSKSTTDLTGKDRQSYATRIGLAIKAIFPDDPLVHNTRQFGPKTQQKRYYVGLSLNS